MGNIQPLVPTSEFLVKGIYKATAFGGPRWATYREAEDEYENTFLRGTGVFEEDGYRAVEKDARARLARVVRSSPEEVAFVANATEGLIKLLGCMTSHIGRGDNLVTPEVAYPTVALAGKRLLRPGTELRLCPPTTEGIIAAIDEKTKVVGIEAVNYVTCELYDLEAIADAAHRMGARIVVDVSQVVGTMPLSVAPVDAIVTTAYKWLSGTNGLGVCWVNLDRWPIWEEMQDAGWHSSAESVVLPHIRLPELKRSAQCLEHGGLPWLPIYILRDALRNLQRFDLQVIDEHVKGLGTETIQALKAFDLGLTILTPEDPQRRGPYISVKMADEKAREVCRRLNAMDIYLSFGQGRLRISSWIFNGSDDVRIALEALNRVLRDMGYAPVPAWLENAR